MTPTRAEPHRTSRIGWLRAAILGANDGILSTASIVVGVAAAQTPRHDVLLAGVAGLVAGALSMAAGEYVSVSSQSDTERADIDRERVELATMPEAEEDELTQIYVGRGLNEPLAREVAHELMAKDALAAHVRDELGFSEDSTARPIQAAFTSACTFAAGGAVPVAVLAMVDVSRLAVPVAASSILCLAALGAAGAWVGGASLIRGALRVAFWGALAMAVTAIVGSLFGVRG